MIFDSYWDVLNSYYMACVFFFFSQYGVLKSGIVFHVSRKPARGELVISTGGFLDSEGTSIEQEHISTNTLFPNIQADTPQLEHKHPGMEFETLYGKDINNLNLHQVLAEGIERGMLKTGSFNNEENPVLHKDQNQTRYKNNLTDLYETQFRSEYDRLLLKNNFNVDGKAIHLRMGEIKNKLISGDKGYTSQDVRTSSDHMIRNNHRKRWTNDLSSLHSNRTLKRSNELSSFTLLDVERRRIMYRHDGSETSLDSVTLHLELIAQPGYILLSDLQVIKKSC